MEAIRGKRAVRVDAADLVRQISGYPQVLVDLGTGDGRFVRHVATTSPTTFAIGIDLCAANLRETSRRAPDNALFIVGSAYTLPHDLHDLATHVTINFPWGELLSGLLTQGPEAPLPAALAALCGPGARLEIRLNAGALAALGWTVHAAGMAIQCSLKAVSFDIAVPLMLDARELRAYPTTWAHRLAFGRDPRALYLHGIKANNSCSV
jgi:hypothetical protein